MIESRITFTYANFYTFSLLIYSENYGEREFKFNENEQISLAKNVRIDGVILDQIEESLRIRI